MMLELKKANNFNVVAIVFILLFSTFLGYYFTPKNSLVNNKPPIDLAANIPAQFGDWQIDPHVSPITTPADLQSKIDELYSEVLSRTYINSKGERVMLSIAYGRNQGGESTQVHRPEICYRAQGFMVDKEYPDVIKTAFTPIPVERILTSHGERIEPVTYWILLGEHLVKSGFDRKLWQIKYGIQRKMPDGLLFRISTIDSDVQKSLKIQDQFVNELLNNLDPTYLPVLIGSRSAE